MCENGDIKVRQHKQDILYENNLVSIAETCITINTKKLV